MCGSGMKAAMLAHDLLASGTNEVKSVILIASFFATSASEFWAAVCFSIVTLIPSLPRESAISCDAFSMLMSLFWIEKVTGKPFG